MPSESSTRQMLSRDDVIRMMNEVGKLLSVGQLSPAEVRHVIIEVMRKWMEVCTVEDNGGTIH